MQQNIGRRLTLMHTQLGGKIPKLLMFFADVSFLYFENPSDNPIGIIICCRILTHIRTAPLRRSIDVKKSYSPDAHVMC